MKTNDKHMPGASVEEWRAEVLRMYPSAAIMRSPASDKHRHATVGAVRVGAWFAPDHNHVREFSK